MHDDNFYAAPTARVDHAFDYGAVATDDVMLATRSSRLVAAIIDGLLSLVVMVALAIPAFLTYVARSEGRMPVDNYPWLLPITVVYVLILGGLNLYWLSKNGQTIGKKVMKIKIVRSDLVTPATLGRILGLRVLPFYLVSLIPMGGLMFFLDSLFIFSAEQRCLHDKIADTHVIQVGSAFTGNSGYSARPPASSW